MNTDPVSLDRTDIAILAQLQRDGRITNAELAERVNLSASACLRRTQRLEHDGVIGGYGAWLDPTRVGLGLQDRKSTSLNSSPSCASRMPSSACNNKIIHPSRR